MSPPLWAGPVGALYNDAAFPRPASDLFSRRNQRCIPLSAPHGPSSPCPSWPGPLLLTAAEPRIADSLQPFVDNNTLAGAVTLVASRDKVLSLEAVGYADVGAKTPMKTDNLFWIASMSKPMTAAALMMLVDEGKVKLDDPVEKYLPEFKGQWLIAEQDDSHCS